MIPGSFLFPPQGQFGVQEEDLMRCLICTMSVTRGESIHRFHNQQQAEGVISLLLWLSVITLLLDAKLPFGRKALKTLGINVCKANPTDHANGR